MAFIHVLALVPAAVTWAGKEEQEVSPLALSQTEGQRKVGAGPVRALLLLLLPTLCVSLSRRAERTCTAFSPDTHAPDYHTFPFTPQVLDRRPSVPRLPLGRLLSGDQGAQLPPVAVAADEAAISAAEAQPLQSRPTVPRLALSKLNPLAAGASGVSSQAAAGGGSGRGGSGSGRWRPTAQASRIPAANFSTLDATAQRSPTKMPSGECGAGGAVLVQKAKLGPWCPV